MATHAAPVSCVCCRFDRVSSQSVTTVTGERPRRSSHRGNRTGLRGYKPSIATATMAEAEAVEKPLAEISNSPEKSRPGDKPKPPMRQQTVGLEEQMAELLAGTSALTQDCKDANKDCLRVQRRSRELSRELGDLAEEVKSKAGAAKIWRLLGAPGGGEVDLSDSALRDAFKKIDIDGSGGLDQNEIGIVRAHSMTPISSHPTPSLPTHNESPPLLQAIKVANPDATDDTIKTLISQADGDGDGNIDFVEFCKIMRHTEEAQE